jgi:hypothetical protein
LKQRHKLNFLAAVQEKKLPPGLVQRLRCFFGAARLAVQGLGHDNLEIVAKRRGRGKEFFLRARRTPVERGGAGAVYFPLPFLMDKPGICLSTMRLQLIYNA